jgi:hypothetical protein
VLRARFAENKGLNSILLGVKESKGGYLTAQSDTLRSVTFSTRTETESHLVLALGFEVRLVRLGNIGLRDTILDGVDVHEQ